MLIGGILLLEIYARQRKLTPKVNVTQERMITCEMIAVNKWTICFLEL